MKCERCNKEHDGSYGSGRFCSSKCARSFSTSKNREETNKKVSSTLKKTWSRYKSEGKTFWNPDTIKTRGKAGAEANHQKKLKRFVKIRGDVLDITYGELEEYRKTHRVCEMCGAKPSTKRNGRNKRLVIDHDHKTKKFRGLLCVTCNRFLGYYDNSKHLAEEYYRKKYNGD